jgi:hypothetical protein
MIFVDTQLCVLCDGYAGFARAAPSRCRAIEREAHSTWRPRARRIDCLAEESSNQLLAAIEQEAEVCRQLAGKFLQLEATILAAQRRRKPPNKKEGAPLGGEAGLGQTDFVPA